MSKGGSFLLRLFSQGMGIGAFLLCLYACKPGIPSGVLSPSELEEVLYDYHLGQAVAENSNDSVEVKKYMYAQAVFEKHGITSADFDSTMVWYSIHATYLKDIYKRLSERYESEAKIITAVTGEGELYSNLSAQGDTANIWQDRAFWVLRPYRSEDKLLFSIHADSTFRVGDEFLWRFDSRFIAKSGTNDAYVALYIRYANDSVVASTQRILSKTEVKLRVKGDERHAIQSVNGFVYLKQTKKSGEYQLMLLDRMMLVRFHHDIAPKEATPVLESDTLRGDTVDSAALSLPVVPVREKRLSPEEFRERRPVERSIHVVKEKPYRVVKPSRKPVRHSSR